jgi:hypothetical protein
VDTPKPKPSIKGKHLFVAAGSIVGWIFVLTSVPLYLFYWRVSNEPGAGSGMNFWITATVCLGGGGLLTLATQLYLLVKKSWILLLITWAFCTALLIGAVYLSPILLLFMV